MNSNIKSIAAFVIGLSVGAVGTYLALKSKKEALEERCESLEERIEGYLESSDSNPQTSDDKDDSSISSEQHHWLSDDPSKEIGKVGDIIESNGYTMYSDSEKEIDSKGRKIDEDLDAPKVIKPDEFGDDPDYDTASLYYFTDGVLTDDEYGILYDQELFVGSDDIGSHFGEYEEDAVYVKNDRFRVYYEVLKDERTYEEARQEMPHI